MAPGKKGGKKRRTLGRGMGDLIGNDLESLVRPQPPAGPGPEPRGKGGGEERGARVSADPDPAPADPRSGGPDRGAEIPADPRAGAAAEADSPPAAGRDPGMEAPADRGSGQAVAPDAPPADAPDRPVQPPADPGSSSAAVTNLAPAGGRDRRAEAPANRSPSRVPPARPHAEPEQGLRSGTPHPRIFAVASGKGGTGKSLVAVNLAVAMAEHRRVCLIDADFGLGNAHILMGLLPRYNVAHLVRNERSLEQVLVEGPRGVLLLPGASGVPEMASLDDGAMDALASTVGPVLDRCDAVILDCPGGITRQSLLMLHGADVVIVVTNDELTSMTDAYALIKTLVTYRPDLTVGLVVNDAATASEGAETYRKVCHVARKFLGREILSLGTIPRDAHFERSVMERRPLVVGHPRSAAARAVEDLAARLLALQGLDRSLGFPERMHRTLAAATSARGGDGLCMS